MPHVHVAALYTHRTRSAVMLESRVLEREWGGRE